MKSWTALRDELAGEFALLDEEGDRLLLACDLPLGRWLVRVRRGERRGVSTLEVSVLIGRAGALPLSIGAVNDNLAAGRLTLSNDYLVLHDTVPLEGAQLAAVRVLIDQLAGEARRVSTQMLPLLFAAAFYGHFAE